MTIRLMHSSLFLLAMVIIAAVPAAAQDEPRLGVVAAYPGSVGLLWQVSDRFAIRGDGSFSWSKTTSEPENGGFVVVTPTLPPPLQFEGPTTETSSRSATVGVSALIDVHRRDQLRLYVAPRAAIAFSKTTSRITSPIPPEFERFFPQLREREFESSAPSFGFMFGASTKIGARFGVFGEAGLSYTRVKPDLAFTRVTARDIGTRGGVGAMLFF